MKPKTWSIEYDPRTAVSLRKLDRGVRREILDYMDFRVGEAQDPRQLGKALGGSKSGLWRYRVRDYRIICEIRDRQLVVLVVHLGHRSTVYED